MGVASQFDLVLASQLQSGAVGTLESVNQATRQIYTPTPGVTNGYGPGPSGPQGAEMSAVMPGDIVPQPGGGGDPWIWPLIMGIIGGVLFDDPGVGGGGETPGALVGQENGGQVVPAGQSQFGANQEAFADFGGFGKGSPQAEGWIHSGRTTDGTGTISAETFRAWDPIQQKYYQLHGKNPYSNITLMPGRVLPGIGGFVTKTWVTHAWRKDGSLASTQMAMTSTGRMISLSETGVMKNWRPYKSIVIGKSLTTSNLRRVSTKVKSHAKSLKKLLKILK